MKGARIGGLVALAAVILAVILTVHLLLPAALDMIGGIRDADDRASIPRPENLAPSAGGIVYGHNVTLEWSPDARADAYIILITVPGGPIATLNLTSTASYYELDNVLTEGSYQWTVQAVVGGTYGPFSDATLFTIRTTLEAPRPLSPADGSVHVNSVPTLRWSSITDATGYRLQIAGDTEFTDIVVDVQIYGTSYTPAFIMEDWAVYSWRVSAYHGEAWSPWSIARQFSHDYFLAAPSLGTPASGSAVDGGVGVNLTWSEVTGAVSYRVQVSTSGLFISLAASAEVADEWYLIPSALDDGMTYHWRVQAVNGMTESGWSASSSFIVPEDSMPFSCTWTYDGRTWMLNGSVPGIEYYRLSGLARTFTYASYVMDSDPTVVSVASELKGIAQAEGYGDDLAQFILAFVQGLPYTDDLNTTGQIEYPRYPVETLVDGGGDCEDKAALYASLMQCSAIDVDAVMIMFTSQTGGSGHMAVGIAGSYSGAYYLYGGKSFFFCETTGVGWLVGEMPGQLREGYDAEILPC